MTNKELKAQEREYKEALQRTHNYLVMDAYESAMRTIDHSVGKRLRSCQAWVYDAGDYWVLRSYNSYVAVINKAEDVCYDALRCVYGYTSTSAQHIAKFRHDYGSGKWGCEETLTWREC